MSNADFPQVFKQNKRKELDELVDLKKQQLKEECERIESEAETYSYVQSQFLMQHPNGNFSDYLHVVSRYKYIQVSSIFALLGFVLGFVLYSINPDWIGVAFSNGFMCAIVCAIMGYVICFVARWIVGYIYGAILGFIGYPIFKLCYNFAVKKERVRMQQVEADAEKQIEDAIQRTQTEVETAAEKTEQEIEEYISWFADEVAKQVQHMKDNLILKNIAVWATSIFKDVISKSSRATHIATVQEEILLRVYSDAVTCESGSLEAQKIYDFEENRCANLESTVVATASSVLIANKIKESIFDELSTHSPKKVFNINIETIEDEEHACATVCISYTEKNENYQPIQQW